MSEKPESDEFEEEEVDEGVGEEVDVDRVMRDIDRARRRGGAPKGDEPAWRRLERALEERRVAELTSDFDDYDIGGEQGEDAPPAKKRRG